MNDSILGSIKTLLGIDINFTAFDTDLIIHINSVFSILYQLGVGEKYFRIENDSSTWEDFLGKDEDRLDLVKSYVHAKVRIMFDPPTSSAVMQAFNDIIKELEWRINITADPKKEEI